MTSQRSQSVPQQSLFRRGLRYSSVSLLLGGTIVGTGCLDRPIGVSKPVTTNVVVERQINNAINGIDLLLMIDNSSSMADKQAVLASAVPQLLGQLVQPSCVNADGSAVLDAQGQPTHVLLGQGTCGSGAPDFNPVNNIHIGIVTSSLGDHGGGSLCTPGTPTSFLNPDGTAIVEPPDVNDEGHLVGTLARYTSTTNPTAEAKMDTEGFLAWGDSTKPNMNDNDLTAATGIFRDMVSSTHEIGCGLEAQLEGWFRFLVDPVPPQFPIQKVGTQAQRAGSDDALLAQRAAFLRPDSLVAILMLTDENDCSLRDTDVGWVATDTVHTITSGSSACATNPNDPCCYSCTASGPPGKCANGCQNAATTQVDDGPFQANIRCYHQKRRFGYEFMYPTSRYVVGLTKPKLCPNQSFGDMDCDCTYAKSIGAGCNPGNSMPNPLYSTTLGVDSHNNSVISTEPNAIARTDNSIIFLAGIIGVPWQDIGYLDANGNLVYIPVTDQVWLKASPASPNQPITAAPNGIWANINGDDNANIVPQDIHMVESITPRPGINTGDPINGGEWNTAFEDLEYACIFPLPKSRACACNSASQDYSSCKYLNPNDCCDLTFSVDGENNPNSAGSFNKPLCNGNTQVNAKGYPGQREIEVLHDYALSGTAANANSIVASICPKDLTSSNTSAGYGYNPAVAALVNRLKAKLKGSCLPRQLTVDPNTDQVPCNVVEVVGGNALNGVDCNTYCQNNGRNVDLATGQVTPVSAQMSAAVFDQMTQAGLCGAANTPACNTFCTCLLPQEDNTPNATPNGSDVATCQNADDGTVTQLPPGYCYVDPSQADINGNPIGNADLVSKCQDTQRRILRFAGNLPSGQKGVAVPLSGAMVFTACQGSALGNN